MAEFELPENTVWDVQYWTNDSTIGWASAIDSTITYTHDYRIAPLQSTSALPYPSGSGLRHVDDLAISFQAVPTSNMSVVVAQNGTHSRSVGIHDLESNQLIFGPSPFLSEYWTDQGECESCTYGVLTTFRNWSSVAVWPPPPLPSTIALLEVVNTDISANFGCCQGESDSFITNTSYLYLMSIPDSAFGFNFGADASFYSRFDSMVFVAHNRLSVLFSNINSYYFGSNYKYSQIVAGQAGPTQRTTCESGPEQPLCEDLGALALLDSSNQQRIVFSDGVCLDWPTNSTVWEDSNTAGKQFAARLPYENFDRLFTIKGDRFFVYAGGNGQLIDSTTSFLGEVQYDLSLPNRPGEFVCYDSLSQMIRIYRVARPIDMTIAIDEGSSNIRLSWTSISTAASYIVCRSQFADVDFCEQDAISVADTFLTLPLIVGINKEFFRVKAVFE